VVWTIILAGVLMANRPAARIEAFSTTLEQPWSQVQVTELDGLAESDLSIDAGHALHDIDGFGGCFNELGWDTLSLLPAAQQKRILDDLFGKEGLALAFGRMPIASNDYSRDYYSYNETRDDFEMKHFDIARDRTSLIPYIQAALRINPKLKIWGSPWCPPAWMKVNGHYAGRPDPQYNDLPVSGAGEEMADQFRLEPKVLKSYALYFAKYVEAYAKEGIKIWAVMPQNEPNSSQNFPSCVWRPESLAMFTGKYLGPELAARKLKTQVWLGTIERPQMDRCEAMLNDPQVKEYVVGAGFQWAGMDALPLVHQKYTGLRIMQTETMCGDGANDWNAGAATFRQICRNLRNGANAYMYWNLILDEGGVSHWGWRQNAPVIVNPKTLRVTYTAEYWAMKHISRFVPPGSRLLSSSANADVIAFVRPDKKIVAAILNDSNELRTMRVSVRGKCYELSLKPKSFTTAIL